MTLEDRQTDIDPEARKNSAAAIVSPVRSVPVPTIPAPGAAVLELPAATIAPPVSSSPTSSGELDRCAIGSLIVGRYLIEKKLGQGGMGAVYLGRDRRLMDRRVVVKVLLGEFVGDEWVIRKFLQEKEALTRANHPGIVGILDAGELPGGKPFLVMEYIDGVTLHDAIPPGGIDLKRAGNLIRQIGSALAAAHSNGIYHRDLKPENIMLQCLSGGEEQVRIIDFGIAKVHNSLVSDHTVAGRFGTYVYMSPEQFRVEEITSASDVYSMGAIAYEAVTGHAPFNPKGFKHLGDMYSAGVKVPPRELRRELPERAQKLILKALAQRPQDRFQNAVEFGDALAQALIVTRTVRARATSWKGVVKRLQVQASPSRARLAQSPSSQPIPPPITLPPATSPQTNPPQENPAQAISPQESSSQVRLRQTLLGKGSLMRVGVPVAVVVVAALAVVMVAILIVQMFASKSKTLQANPTFGVREPAVSSSAPVPATTSRASSLTYWLTVQKISDPRKGQFDSSGEETFDSGDKIQLKVSVPKAGYLYVLNQGTAGNLEMIRPKLGSRGSAKLESDRPAMIGSYQFTGEPGTEHVLMIWSSASIAELEAARDEANANKGRLTEAAGSLVREFLLSANSETQNDTGQRKTVFSGNADLLVKLLKLEHR